MRDGWDKRKIGEICEVLNGFAFKSSEYVENGIRVIRITNVQKGYVVDDDPKYYPMTAKESIKSYLLNSGDLLMSLTGNVGRVGVLQEEMLPAALNQRVACLRIKDKRVLLKYLFHNLNSPIFEQDCINSASGVAQKNMSTEWLKRYLIVIPPIAEQEKIIAELDCLTGIIEKKKQQLKELDNLAQSIFYDTFGDPIANDKGWEMCKVGDCMKVIGGYAFKSSSYSKSGYRLVQIANVWKDELVWDEITYISFDDKQVSSSFILKEGDVLMAMTRPVIKSLSAVKIAIVRKEDTPCILNQRVCKFVSNGRLSIIWFYNFARTEYFKDNIVGFGSKGMQPNVSAREIESIKMYLPPRSLQDLYAKKIDAIEKQKELVKRSIVETETLFNSRMDYWFN